MICMVVTMLETMSCGSKPSLPSSSGRFTATYQSNATVLLLTVVMRTTGTYIKLRDALNCVHTLIANFSHTVQTHYVSEWRSILLMS